MPTPKALASQWEKRFRDAASPDRAKLLQRFFQTGPGQYGEGDVFLGSYTVPQVRALAREGKDLGLDALAILLDSTYHEVRLFALIVLTERAKELKMQAERLELAEWTLAHREGINNWDLVDTCVPTLIGGVAPTDTWVGKIAKLLASKRLWDRRLAMVATCGWMRQGNLKACFSFAETLLPDTEDLMHKAAGWMLREAGKRDVTQLHWFLEENAAVMPRTMLRYAIERLSPPERARYLMARKRQVGYAGRV